MVEGLGNVPSTFGERHDQLVQYHADSGNAFPIHRQQAGHDALSRARNSRLEETIRSWRVAQPLGVEFSGGRSLAVFEASEGFVFPLLVLSSVAGSMRTSPCFLIE